MRWLRRFFYSDDPLVRIVAGVSYQDAELWKDMLANEGIPATSKNMNFLSVSYYLGHGPADFDLWVRQSDLERAQAILAPILEQGEERP